MFGSVHTAEWLAQFQAENINFQLLPFSPNRQIHPNLMELLAQTCAESYSTHFPSEYFALPLWFGDKLLGIATRGARGRRIMKTWQTLITASASATSNWLKILALLVKQCRLFPMQEA